MVITTFFFFFLIFLRDRKKTLCPFYKIILFHFLNLAILKLNFILISFKFVFVPGFGIIFVR